MALVVDASVAVKFLVREPGNEEARRLLTIPDPLIAPDWILVEAASAFSRKVQESELLDIHAFRHLEDLPQFFESLFPAGELVDDALRHAFRLRHAVYDCLYLALALREDCPLVTADGEFAAAVRRGGYGEKLWRLD
ncbi:MAG TPA: type II toxin-antitoxin system VapC family toxin [Allosphingosinicella sp.]|jgi:predicted nucleic acid-binding protein